MGITINPSGCSNFCYVKSNILELITKQFHVLTCLAPRKDFVVLPTTPNFNHQLSVLKIQSQNLYL